MPDTYIGYFIMKKTAIRKLEQFVTKAGVIMLAFMTFIGILFVIDLVFDGDIFPTDTGKNAFLVLCLIIVVLIFSCVMVAYMLNISRIANAIEDLSENRNDSNKNNINCQ